MCFPVNFAKFLRIPFLQNTSGRLLLSIDRLSTKTVICTETAHNFRFYLLYLSLLSSLFQKYDMQFKIIQKVYMFQLSVKKKSFHLFSFEKNSQINDTHSRQSHPQFSEKLQVNGSYLICQVFQCFNDRRMKLIHLLKFA